MKSLLRNNECDLFTGLSCLGRLIVNKKSLKWPHCRKHWYWHSIELVSNNEIDRLNDRYKGVLSDGEYYLFKQ